MVLSMNRRIVSLANLFGTVPYAHGFLYTKNRAGSLSKKYSHKLKVS